jgi:hypothetical protein
MLWKHPNIIFNFAVYFLLHCFTSLGKEPQAALEHGQLTPRRHNNCTTIPIKKSWL